MKRYAEVKLKAIRSNVTLGSKNLEIEGLGFTKPHQLVVFGKAFCKRGKLAIIYA
jgi:hypothetical protein